MFQFFIIFFLKDQFFIIILYGTQALIILYDLPIGLLHQFPPCDMLTVQASASLSSFLCNFITRLSDFVLQP